MSKPKKPRRRIAQAFVCVRKVASPAEGQPDKRVAYRVRGNFKFGDSIKLLLLRFKWVTYFNILIEECNPDKFLPDKSNLDIPNNSAGVSKTAPFLNLLTNSNNVG